jgi:hypothetical protein
LSRINRAPVSPGDTVDATPLNAAYTDFAQTAALDQFNTRDSAFDLAHLRTSSTGALMLLDVREQAVGTGDILHAAPASVSSAVAGPATPSVVTGGAGSVLSYGGSGLAMQAGMVLRVYSSLGVRPRYTGTPWANSAPDALGQYDVLDGSGGSTVLSLGAHFWIVQLQWDITSSALINWAPVSGAGNFQSVVVSGLYGQSLQTMRGCACVPAWNLMWSQWRNGDALAAGSMLDRTIGWYGAPINYVLLNNASRTVYGLRLVVHGIYHSYRDTNTNYAVLDVNVAGTLEYDQGNITSMLFREQ